MKWVRIKAFILNNDKDLLLKKLKSQLTLEDSMKLYSLNLRIIKKDINKLMFLERKNTKRLRQNLNTD